MAFQQTDTIHSGGDSAIQNESMTQTISTLTDTSSLLKKPVLQVVKANPVAQKYYASSSDSLLFHLKGYPKCDEGYFNDNPLTRYLKPLPSSDKTYINGDVSRYTVSHVDSSQVHHEQLAGIKSPDVTSESDMDSTVQEEIMFDVSEKSNIEYGIVFQETGAAKVDQFHEGTFVMQPSPRGQNPFVGTRDWMSGLILMSIIIIGVLRISSMKFLRELLLSVAFFQNAHKLFVTVNVRNSKPSVTLNFLYFITTSLFIYETLTFYNRTLLGISGLGLFVIISSILAILFSTRFLMYKFIGFVFETGTETSEYIFNTGIINKIMGIFMIPITAFVPFINGFMVPVLIYFGAIVFLLLYVIQIFRGAKIILTDLLSIFYMFLYLCALEILPLSILYKVLIH